MINNNKSNIEITMTEDFKIYNAKFTAIISTQEFFDKF